MKSVCIFLSLFLIVSSQSESESIKCKLARALHDEGSCAQEIASLLCVSKALTNNFSSIKSGSGEDTHWGHFMVSQKWWCGTNEVGGQCNIRCNDLLTDFAKNANCGLKVYKIHGLSAWKLQNVCLDVEIGDLDECLDATNKVQERRGKK